MGDLTVTGLLAVLQAAIAEGDAEASVVAAGRLVGAGVGPGRVLAESIEPAMHGLDKKCTADDFDLLEIMLSGRAVTEVMKVLFPQGVSGRDARGTVVIATPEGDVHDLGKSVLRTVLIGNGYHVVDLGRDCPLAAIVEAAERELPVAVGVSGLITTVIPQVRRIRGLLDEKGLYGVRLLAGGAALKQSTSEGLNVDFVADSAFDAIHFLNELSPRIAP